MRLTRRGTVALALTVIVLALLANWLLGVDDVDSDTGLRVHVTVYEDGSGVQYVNDTAVRTFPDGTFVAP